MVFLQILFYIVIFTIVFTLFAPLLNKIINLSFLLIKHKESLSYERKKNAVLLIIGGVLLCLISISLILWFLYAIVKI